MAVIDPLYRGEKITAYRGDNPDSLRQLLVDAHAAAKRMKVSLFPFMVTGDPETGNPYVSRKWQRPDGSWTYTLGFAKKRENARPKAEPKTFTQI
jgi:hypothetical protein